MIVLSHMRVLCDSTDTQDWIRLVGLDLTRWNGLIQWNQRDVLWILKENTGVRSSRSLKEEEKNRCFT